MKHIRRTRYEHMGNKNSIYRKSGYKKNILKSIFISIVLMVAIVGVTMSRYVVILYNDQVLVPTNFYFESNYLEEITDEDGKVIEEIVTYNVYTDYVDITIMNNNNLRETIEDIDYTISYTVGDGTDPDTVSVVDASGEDIDDTIVTLAHDEDYTGEDDADFLSNTFTLNANSEDVVTITATSSDPYKKTITATFVFHDPDNQTFYRIYDYVYYKELWIFTGEDPSDITINYDPDYYAPDTMNSLMEDWIVNVDSVDDTNHATYTDESFTGTLKVDDTPYSHVEGEEENVLAPNGCYVLIFFENTLTDWKTVDDIILNEDNGFTITLPTTADILADATDETEGE